MNEDLRYPIGKFQFTEPTPGLRRECISQFRIAPGLLRQAIDGLTEAQLQSSYRPQGWTLAQVVHHLAEADVNAYPRLKYALTETNPNVMVADEARWAEVPDAKTTSLAASLAMFEAIRLRWAEAWEALRKNDFSRPWSHAHFGTVPLDHLLQQYAWHARHHTAQITSHRKRMGW